MDLLVTDMVMPGMSDPDVAAQLAQVQPELKVLVCVRVYQHPSITEGRSRPDHVAAETIYT